MARRPVTVQQGAPFGFNARGRQHEARVDMFARMREQFPTPRTKVAREVEAARLEMEREAKERIQRLYGGSNEDTSADPR